MDADTERTSFLRTVPLFCEVMESDLPYVDGLMKEEVKKAGETVFREDELGGAIYIIMRGTVRVLKGGADPVELAVLRERDHFGEMSVLDWEERSASVLALSDLRLLVISRDGLHQLISTWPQIGIAMLKSLSIRLREVQAELLEARRGAGA